MAGERILIVEDETIVAKDIQFSLKNLGYTVAGIVASGAEAVSKARELKPDLVLMDVMLKGPMDGIAAAEQIRSQGNIPVVYLTAYIDEQTLKRAKASEAFGYLLKPFEERELRTTIEMALYRHLMERKLLESHEWFETTIRCLGDAVIATDAGDSIQLINPMAETLTGWARGDAIGRKLADVFCLKEPSALPAKADLQGPAGWATEYGKDSILVSRDGHPVPIDYSLAPIKGGASEHLGIVVVFRDVSSRRQAEDHERELQQRLSRSKRMESVGILAGGVANDLNNILRPIVDYSGSIMTSLAPDSPLRADLEIINNSSRKAIGVAHDLLTLGRIGHEPLEPVNLNEVLEACWQSPEFKAFQAKAPLVVGECRLAPNLPPIMGSRQHLRDLAMNLLINALDAMPNGGRLILRSAPEELTRAHEGYEIVEPGKYVVLRVTSTGGEIAKDDLNQIFEPFYTKRKLGWQSGSGLGLALVYGVAKDHQGFLDLSSKPGQGSEFVVYFPMAGAAVVAAQLAEPVDNQGTETILVVDDDEEERQSVARWLRSRGYMVLAAANGRAACEAFQGEAGSRAVPIDLVLLDMVMGDDWDGLDTYRNILAVQPKQKAIMISGFAITNRIKEALRLGAGQYLQKPCSLEEIGKAVRIELDKP